VHSECDLDWPAIDREQEVARITILGPSENGSPPDSRERAPAPRRTRRRRNGRIFVCPPILCIGLGNRDLRRRGRGLRLRLARSAGGAWGRPGAGCQQAYRFSMLATQGAHEVGIKSSVWVLCWLFGHAPRRTRSGRDASGLAGIITSTGNDQLRDRLAKAKAVARMMR